MANHRLDIAGVKFGMLSAVRPHHKDEAGRWLWEFDCECGNSVVRAAYSVKRKTSPTTSCGCVHHLKTHGLSSECRNLNWVWSAMRQRCMNPANKDYPNYGGRGIVICDEWGDFAEFHKWAVGTGYRKGVTIERVDVNGNYEPSNCTWIANERQALNTRKIRLFEYQGSQLTIRQLADIAGVSPRTMKSRLTSYGWSVERAVSEPAFKGKNQTFKGASE